MPTILRENGWAVFICTDDHVPPHVHVKRDNGYVKIHLVGPDGLPEVVKIVRVADHQVWRALAIVNKHQQHLLREWRIIHG
jgi:hypothetical protein